MGRGRLALALYCCAAHVAGDAFGRSENAVVVLQDAGGAGTPRCAICLTGACSQCKMCLGIGKFGPCSACYGDTPGGVCLLNKRKANQFDCRSCWHVDDEGNPPKPQTHGGDAAPAGGWLTGNTKWAAEFIEGETILARQKRLDTGLRQMIHESAISEAKKDRLQKEHKDQYDADIKQIEGRQQFAHILEEVKLEATWAKAHGGQEKHFKHLSWFQAGTLAMVMYAAALFANAKYHCCACLLPDNKATRRV